MKTNMYLGAPNRLFSHARHSRQHPTIAEHILWERLRGNQTGYKFRRQHPMLNYLVDFYCHALQYVIEVDGSIHGEPMNDTEDKNKDLTLEENGIYVQRFTNEAVINDIESVMEQIHATLSFLKEKRFYELER